MRLLWLDDQRPPPDGWTWARTAAQCVALLRSQEWDVVHLDHDLGPTRTCGTGAVVLRWLLREARHGRPVPEVRVHTRNPRARGAMEAGAAAVNAMRARAPGDTGQASPE